VNNKAFSLSTVSQPTNIQISLKSHSIKPGSQMCKINKECPSSDWGICHWSYKHIANCHPVFTTLCWHKEK